jgi:hypothetical protein
VFEIVYKSGWFRKSVVKFDSRKYAPSMDDLGVYVYKKNKNNKMVFAILRKNFIEIKVGDND